MNERVREMWVAAMCSGEYVKGRLHLKYRERYCALGVLCDLYRQDTGRGDWVKDGARMLFRNSSGVHTSTIAPQDVQTWAGLTTTQCNDVTVHSDDSSDFEATVALVRGYC